MSELEGFEICEDHDLCLNRLNYEDNLAVAVSREYAWNTRFLGRSSTYCFENSEAIDNYALKVLMKKDFPFVSELNNFIKYATEGGLIVKWLKDSRVVQRKREQERISFSPLRLQNIHGILIIYASLWIFTFITALLEQIIYRQTRKPNTARFWIYAEMAIDEERHFLLRHIEL